MSMTMTADQLGHGIVSPRGGSTRRRLEQLHIPGDLSGKSFLDIGAWDGAFSFVAEERGAARIVAVNQKPKPGLELAIRARGSRVEAVQADLNRLGPDTCGGPFDVVLFSGVLYHLPNPSAGLERVLTLTKPGGLMDLRDRDRPEPCERAGRSARGRPQGPRQLRLVAAQLARRRLMLEQAGFERVEVMVIQGSACGSGSAARTLTGRHFNARCVLHAHRPGSPQDTAA